MPLQIAYTHYTNASKLRKCTQQKSNSLLKTCKLLEEQLQQKRQELSLANEELNIHTRTVGAWTRYVFDLELNEPCEWNSNYRKLMECVERNNGKLPLSLLDITKANTNKEEDDADEERILAVWLDGMYDFFTFLA